MKSRRGQWINWAGLRCTARVLLQPELARPRLCVESVASLDWRALRDAHGLSGVVLDKDNTVTLPYAGALHPRVEAAVRDAQAVFGADRVVLFSNSAGSPDDADYAEARALHASLGLPVLRHAKRKPLGGEAIEEHFGPRAVVAVVGDRYWTDVVLGNLHGHFTVRVAPLDASRDNAAVRVVRRLEVAWARWQYKDQT